MTGTRRNWARFGAVALACTAAVACCLGTTALQPQAAEAKAKAPAKVKIASAEWTGTSGKSATVVVKVKKAKRATGYQYRFTPAEKTLWPETKTASKTTCKISVRARWGKSWRTVVRKGLKVKARAWAKSGKKKVWGKWSKSAKVTAAEAGGSASAGASMGTTSQETDESDLPAPKYDYRVRFLTQPMATRVSGRSTSCPVYIETDNPNPYFNVEVIGDNGKVMQRSSAENYSSSAEGIPTYGEAGCLDSLSACRFGDGYLTFLAFPKTLAAGSTCTIGVAEGEPRAWNGSFEVRDSTSVKTVCAVTLGDLDAEEEAWMDSVIDETCDPSASKKEQMLSVAHWLESHCRYMSGFYKGRDNTEIGFTPAQKVAVESCLTYAQQLDRLGYLLLDSSKSPALLCRFGEKIGYPLEDMYGKYPADSEEWKYMHYKAYSAEDDCYFEVYNPGITVAELAAFPSFDPGTWDFYDLQ